MAFYTIRINLGAAQFPLLTELGGRSIIVPGQDENYDRTVISTSSDTDKDKGIPQALFVQNCFPTATGYQSINFLPLVEAYPAATDFGTVLPLQTVSFGRVLLVPSGGKNYILDLTVSTGWNVNSSFPPGTVPENVQVTTAFVKGETYIYYANFGCYRYDTTVKQLVAVPLVGVVAADIVAILASNGYMVVVTNNALAWSSLIDPTDFTPDITTGAGGGNLAEADGRIISAYSMGGGFLVYCENNVVSAKITSNISFPFAFNPVPGAGGVSTGDAVSWQANISDHYVWTTSGLQQINLTSVKFILSDFTDFIAANELEDFDSVTNLLSSTLLSTPMQVAVHVVGLRYVVISYGPNYPDYDYALVYDTVLKRNGKLKIRHRDCFEWNFPNLYGDITYDGLEDFSYDDLGPTTYDDLAAHVEVPHPAKEDIAFIQANGVVYRVDFSLDRDTGDGVFYIGKFQFVRNLELVHLDTQFETVGAEINTFDALLVNYLNGKDVSSVERMFPIPPKPGSKLRAFKKQRTGVNQSIILKGSFNLTSGLIRFTTGGIPP